MHEISGKKWKPKIIRTSGWAWYGFFFLSRLDRMTAEKKKQLIFWFERKKSFFRTNEKLNFFFCVEPTALHGKNHAKSSKTFLKKQLFSFFFIVRFQPKTIDYKWIGVPGLSWIDSFFFIDDDHSLLFHGSHLHSNHKKLAIN